MKYISILAKATGGSSSEGRTLAFCRRYTNFRKVYLRQIFRPLFLLALLGSCKKQLDLLPTDTIPPAKAFSSVSDLEKGLEGIFQLNTGSLNRVFIGSLLADELKVGANNNGEGYLGFTWQYTANDEGTETEFLSDFAAYYAMIDAINTELAGVDGVTARNNVETALQKRIKAELYALRGIAHFEALIRFMPIGYSTDAPGVPIVLQSNLLGQPSRAKAGDVVTQIRADMAMGRAETAIPAAPDNVTDLSQATIAAYQARVSLLTRDWDSVIRYAGQALALSGKSLTNPATFNAYWFDSTETETLWKYRNQVAPQLFWNNGATIYFEPADKLKNTFDRSGNDIRFTAWFKSNPYPNDSIIVDKYPGSALGPQVNDLKLVRVAELYLDLAEGYAHKDSLNASASNLNTLRENRIIGYMPVSFGDSASAIQAVLNERFKELCYEGFRFFDLKRNGLPVVRDTTDLQSVGDPWLTLTAADHHFALPIPQHEVFANPNMVQNPGY